MDRDVTGKPISEFGVTRINKKFGSYQALHDVSFSVMPGEIMGLIGPNGAGKSTLLECVAGLLTTATGTIWWQGSPLSFKKRKQVIWYLPDAILPFASQQVATTLTFFCQIHRNSKADRDRLVRLLGLSPMLKKPLQTLSKGFRRRVLLALALLSRHPLLMLDEPFDGFDIRQTLSMMDLLRSYQKKRSMILSVHQLTEAEKICDRFLLLDRGHVLGLGTLTELRTQTGLAADATLEEVFLAIT